MSTHRNPGVSIYNLDRFSGIPPPSPNSALAGLNDLAEEQNLDTAEANYALAALNSTAAE
jgi:hypothetical protein